MQTFNKRSFEKFLQEVHSEVYTGLDDEMPDAFDNWLEELDVNDMIEFAELYGTEQYLAGGNVVLKEIQGVI